MSEIKILVDIGGSAASLKDVINDLEKLRDVSEEIRAKKGKLIEAKGSEDIAKLTAEIESLRAKYEKLTAEKVKAKQGASDLDKAINKLTKAQSEEAKELAIVNEQIKKNNKENRDAAQATINNAGVIQKLRNELKEVTKQWTRATDAKQLDASVTGSLAQKKEMLTSKLKRLEEATGDHRRSVGNYAKGLKGLDLILGVVEQKFGIQLGYLRDILGATEKLSKGGKGLTQIFNTTNSSATTFNSSTQTLNSTITKTATTTNVATSGFKAFASSIIESGKALLTSPFTIALVAITALGVGIYALVESTRQQSKAFDDAKKSINEWAESTEDAQDTLNKLKIDLAEQRGVISAREAERKRLVIDRNKELEDLNKDARERAIKIKNEDDEDYIKSDRNRNQVLAELQEKYNKKRLIIFESYNARFKKFTNKEAEDAAEALSERFDFFQKKEEADAKKRLDLAKKIAEQKAKLAQEDADRVRLAIEQERKYEIEAITGKFGEAEQIINKQSIETKIALGTVLPDELVAYNEQIRKEKEDARKKEEDARKKELDDTKIIIEEKKQINDEFIKYEIDALDGSYGEAERIIARQELATKIALRTATIPEIKAWNELLKKEADKGSADKKKRLEEEFEVAERFANAAVEGMQERNASDLQMNADKLTELDKQAQFQRELALKGEANTFQEVEKARAEALAEKAAMEKKAANLAKGEKAAEIFLEFYKAYANEKEGAFMKALTATAKGKGGEAIVKALFSGSFYDGTEDTGGPGNLDGKGGKGAIIHPHERILTRTHNEAIGDISNEEVVRRVNLFDDMPLADKRIDVQVNESLNRALHSELKRIAKAVENPSHIDIQRNYINELVSIERRLGAQIETTHKRIGSSYSRD